MEKQIINIPACLMLIAMKRAEENVEADNRKEQGKTAV